MFKNWKLAACLPFLWVMNVAAHLPLEDGAEQPPHHHRDVTPSAADATSARALFARERLGAFRVSGDDRELEQAWRYLERDLQSGNASFKTLIAAAYVVQAQHQFDQALQYIERAAARRALDDEAWLLKASLHLLAGDVDQARTACRALSITHLMVRLVCQGRVAVAAGNAQAVYTKLESVLPHVATAESAETLAWAHSVLGDLAHAQGLNNAAISHYRDALASSDRSQVRAALADRLIDAGQWDAAWRTLSDPGQSLALVVRRFIVARQVGLDHQARTRIAQADKRFRRWMAQSDWLHAREMARFYLDVLPRPYLAQKLAEINFALQKEPEDRRLIERVRSGQSHGPGAVLSAFDGSAG